MIKNDEAGEFLELAWISFLLIKTKSKSNNIFPIENKIIEALIFMVCIRTIYRFQNQKVYIASKDAIIRNIQRKKSALIII